MARIRSLKPDFFEDEDLAQLPFEHRLVFAGLWCLADKAGRLFDKPVQIKAKLFSSDLSEINKKVNIEKILSELNKKPFIKRYSVDDKKYIEIINFLKHQHPHFTEKESEIPPDNGEITVKTPLSNGYETPVLGKGREGKGVSSTHIPHKEIIDDLNSHLKTVYKSTSQKTQDLIRARFNEGFTLENFKTVHRKKVAEWKNDPNMSKYLRPETLYSNKFESYLNQPEPCQKCKGTGEYISSRGYKVVCDCVKEKK